MKFRNIQYYLRESFLSLVRNRLMSVASIITVASCIFILVFSWCVVSNIDFILKNVEDDMSLSVYLLDSVSDDEIEAITEKILSVDHVVSANYISSEDALAEFSLEYSEDPEFLEGLNAEDARILPRTFDINVDNIIYQDQVRDELSKMIGTEFEKVSYNKESIDFLISLNNIIRIISIITILFLSTISIVIIMNTIKLTVNNRQGEINIMKYVGATDWFIRWPFIIEGMLIGLIGAVFPGLICMLGYGKVIEFIGEEFSALTALFEFQSTGAIFVFLFPFSLILGVGIGSIGSVTSIRRHLDV